MIVYHTGHSAADKARGNSSFYAALDGEILTKGIGDTNVQISCTKMKDAEPFKTMEFLKVTIPLGIEENSLVLELVPTREKPTKMGQGEDLGLKTFSKALESQGIVSKLHVEEWWPFFLRDTRATIKTASDKHSEERGRAS